MRNITAVRGNRLDRRAPDATQRGAMRRRSGALAPPPPRIGLRVLAATTRRGPGTAKHRACGTLHRVRGTESPPRPGRRATAVDHISLIRAHCATSCPRLPRASTSWGVPPRNLGSSHQGRRGWPGRSPAMTKEGRAVRPPNSRSAARSGVRCASQGLHARASSCPGSAPRHCMPRRVRGTGLSPWRAAARVSRRRNPPMTCRRRRTGG